MIRCWGGMRTSFRFPIGFTLCALALSGCFTHKLWSELPAYETYKESVSSVLVSQDGRNLVIVGKEHHYLFDAPPVIVRTLSSDYQKFVTARFGTFSVDSSQSIVGTYSLQIAPEATGEATASARRAGFVEDAQGRLSIDGILSGIRYSAGNVRIPASAHPLMREYQVDVSAPVSSKDDMARKVLLTPLAVLADGVIVLGMVAMIALRVAPPPVFPGR